MFFAEGVERGEDGDDRGFVVGSGAGINAPVVSVGASSRWIRKRDWFAAGFDGVVAKNGSEGRLGGPGGWIDGVAVIVRIENNGMRCAFCVEFAEDDGTAPLNRKKMRFDAACLEHFLEAGGVFFDIRSVASDVGNSEEFAEFADNAVLVSEAVGANLFDDVFGRREDALCFEIAACGHLSAGDKRADGERGEQRERDSKIQGLTCVALILGRSCERDAWAFKPTGKRSGLACFGAQARVPVLLSNFNIFQP